MVEHEYDESGDPLVGVIHLDSILRPAHLIGIYGNEHVPHDLHYSDSLSAFHSFYVNKYSDYLLRPVLLSLQRVKCSQGVAYRCRKANR